MTDRLNEIQNKCTVKFEPKGYHILYDLPCEDVDWLISQASRCEKLEAALISIVDLDESCYEIGEAVKSICRTALSAEGTK